ncbi:MAG: histidinol dehydrogenase [Bacteroidales bacterium]|jgi:histidinol dehydrogenase|nr:histidinol dehydrogenase [Bacteroidales bacterium]
METVLLPEPGQWEALCRRPVIERKDLELKCREILGRVRSKGDKALAEYSELFDGILPSSLRVRQEEIEEAILKVPDDLKKAILTARNNITRFHSVQMGKEPVVETSPGVRCWRKSVAIERVGIYVPGGSAPLFSTVLMLAIPARLAGCSEVIMCTPPGRDGSIDPVILFTASLTGVTAIFKTGGAQAVAAMAYGTETIPPVDKIFGPGNQYVTMAKELVQLDGVPVDMPAGPSEVLVIADSSSVPAFVAADLLSQAEHGPDSQVILLTDSEYVIRQVADEIKKQTEPLPRKEIILRSLEKSKAILLPSVDDCISFSNIYAPEHLIIATEKSASVAEKVTNAGSVFLGNYSCESSGDYATGTNHTLPTNGAARNYSGVSVDSFIKKITFQEVSPDGMLMLGPVVAIMAEAEKLEAHRNAVTIRLNSLKNV